MAAARLQLAIIIINVLRVDAVQHMEHVRTNITIELMVNVLTMGYWPTYTPMDVSLPEDVRSVCLCLCVHGGTRNVTLLSSQQVIRPRSV